MSLYIQLTEILDTEIEFFRSCTKALGAETVYTMWYDIGFYEEFYAMLTSDFAETNLAENEIAWLLATQSPLGFLYKLWMQSDGAMTHAWADMADWIHLVFRAERIRNGVH